MYGKSPNLTRHLSHPCTTELNSEDFYLKILAEKFQLAFSEVEKNTARNFQYLEKFYSKKKDINVGDTVLVFTPKKIQGVSPKILPSFSLPFKVEKKLSYCIFQLVSDKT